jgi:hypothetical protein
MQRCRPWQPGPDCCCPNPVLEPSGIEIVNHCPVGMIGSGFRLQLERMPLPREPWRCLLWRLWRCNRDSKGLSTGAEKVQRPTLMYEHYAKPRHSWAHRMFDRRSNIAISVSVAVVWLGLQAPFSLSTFPTLPTRTGRHALVRHYPPWHSSQSIKVTLLFDFRTAQRMSACRFFLSSNLRPRFATLKLGGERSRIHTDDHHSISSTCIRQPPASRALICMFP